MTGQMAPVHPQAFSATHHSMPWEPRRLTPRELEILSLTVEGLTSREIGHRLGISPRTADVHRAHLTHKLGLRNRAQVIRYAITSGILDVPA